MRRTAMILVTVAILTACSDTPTTPPLPPPPQPQPPAIVSFSVTPAEIEAGDEARILFHATFESRDGLTLRLATGPLNTDAIVYVTPQGEWGDWRWLTWTETSVRLNTRRFPTATTTYTLTLQDAYGSATQSRTVTVN